MGPTGVICRESHVKCDLTTIKLGAPRTQPEKTSINSSRFKFISQS